MIHSIKYADHNDFQFLLNDELLISFIEENDENDLNISYDFVSGSKSLTENEIQTLITELIELLLRKIKNGEIYLD